MRRGQATDVAVRGRVRLHRHVRLLGVVRLAVNRRRSSLASAALFVQWPMQDLALPTTVVGDQATLNRDHVESGRVN